MTAYRQTKIDIGDRSKAFAKDVIDFVRTLPKSMETQILSKQLLRSATSIGANYYEADSSESRKDFEHKLGICAKEAKESEYWLEMINYVIPKEISRSNALKGEAEQLRRIFIAIINKSRNHIK